MKQVLVDDEGSDPSASRHGVQVVGDEDGSGKGFGIGRKEPVHQVRVVRGILREGFHDGVTTGDGPVGIGFQSFQECGCLGGTLWNRYADKTQERRDRPPSREPMVTM